MEIKRIDHLGIVMGIIKDLEIISKIDECISNNVQENITAG